MTWDGTQSTRGSAYTTVYEEMHAWSWVVSLTPYSPVLTEVEGTQWLVRAEKTEGGGGAGRRVTSTYFPAESQPPGAAHYHL